MQTVYTIQGAVKGSVQDPRLDYATLLSLYPKDVIRLFNAKQFLIVSYCGFIKDLLSEGLQTVTWFCHVVLGGFEQKQKG